MTSANIPGFPAGTQIRLATPADIPLLSAFFLEAYGPETIFQNQDFLKWFFFQPRPPGQQAAGSILCLSAEQKVVSFYGGIFSEVLLHAKPTIICWGVNAFTLPQYRGLKLSSHALNALQKHTGLHGVIGFTAKTAGFYQSLGYQVFGLARFSRYIYVCNPQKTTAVIQYLNQDINPEFNSLLTNTPTVSQEFPESEIKQLTSEYCRTIAFDLPCPVALTTHRNAAYLLNRFLENPFISYSIFGVVENNKLVAYAACRDEELMPLGITVTRIIDLYGTDTGVAALAVFVAARAEKLHHAYTDFSSFGTLYAGILQQQGYLKLEGEEYAILPQVSSPVQQRPNLEYVGLYSTANNEVLQNLSPEDTYFTRADADRDRIARITQLPPLTHAG